MALFGFVACDESNDIPAQQSQIANKTVNTVFSPPQSTTLSPVKAKLYVECSTAMLLLAEQWVERLQGQTPTQEKVLILNGYEKARDQVCRKIGLAGLEEYNWITDKAFPDPANKAVLEKAGIQVYTK